MVSVDHCPVYRGGASVLRQQGGVEIECAQTWHSPYRFRKHSEGDHYEKVRIPALEGFEEFRIFEGYRLEDRDVVACGIFLYRALMYLESAAAGLVRNGYDPDYVVSVTYQGIERCDGKFRSTILVFLIRPSTAFLIFFMIAPTLSIFNIEESLMALYVKNIPIGNST